MERENKLKEAMEQVKAKINMVKEEATQTIEELKETTRSVVPRPLRRRIEKRVDDILSGRRRRGRRG